MGIKIMSDEKIGIESFMGLTSVSEAEKLIHQTERASILKITEKLQAWHKNYELEQIKKEDSFSLGNIDKINVNFWDDFHDDGYVPEGEVTESFAVIEDKLIPDIECYKLLNALLEHILDNGLLPPTVKLRMFLADSTAIFPNLIVEHEYMLTKKWNIMITNITHAQLDDLMVRLKVYSNGVPFNIYSES
jgi:hypothetical protein